MAEVETRTETGFRWRHYHTVWYILGFSWIASYMARMAISPTLVPIREEFGLTYAQVGLLVSAFMVSYAVAQMPSGMLGDRMGRRLLLAGGSLLSGVMTLAMGLATSFYALLAVRFVAGLGQSTLMSNQGAMVSQWTPPEKMGLGQGLSLAGSGIGLSLGIILAGAFSQWLGWRWTFIILAFPCLLAGALIWRFILDSGKPATASQRVPFRFAWNDRDLWIAYGADFSGAFGLTIISTWAPAMMGDAGASSLLEASLYASLVGFGMIPGLLINGFIADALARRGIGEKYVVSANLAGFAVVMALVGWGFSAGLPTWMLAGLLFLSGYFGEGYFSPLLALYVRAVPQSIVGTVLGTTTTFAFGAAVLAPAFSGWVRDLAGSYTLSFYVAFMLLLAMAWLMLTIRARPLDAGLADRVGGIA